jgi:hypothetical protein
MGPIGPALALGCRIVLAAVLAFAAVAKIADRRALPERLRAMAIPPPWDARLAIALPVAELAVAVGLVVFSNSSVPALLAILLLGCFTLFLLESVRRAIPCPCFGAVRTASAPTAAGAILRNGFLIALAVIATGSADGAQAGATALVVVIGAAVAAVVVTRVA